MAEPKSRAELLEQVNGLLGEARALALRASPALRTLDDLVDRVRTLLAIIEELEIARARESAQAKVIELQLEATQRAFWALADRTREASAPADEESWAE